MEIHTGSLLPKQAADDTWLARQTSLTDKWSGILMYDSVSGRFVYCESDSQRRQWKLWPSSQGQIATPAALTTGFPQPLSLRPALWGLLLVQAWLSSCTPALDPVHS